MKDNFYGKAYYNINERYDLLFDWDAHAIGEHNRNCKSSKDWFTEILIDGVRLGGCKAKGLVYDITP